MRRSFRVGEWTVEPSLNRLSRGHESVRVEPKVMDLMVFLAERPGRVVDRQELVDGVWGGAIVEDGTLTRAVARLRAALGEAKGSATYLETIPKRGYRLVAEVTETELERAGSPEVGAERVLCVGREAELAALEAHLDAARSGEGRVILITGDAGAGKTVLVHELLARALARDPGLVAVVGACNFYNGTGDPFLPFRQVLAQLTGDFEGVWPALDIGTEQGRRLRGVLPAAVRAVRHRGPDLVGTLLEPHNLRRRLEHAVGGPGLMDELAPLLERATFGVGVGGGHQGDLLEQVSRVLEEVAATQPLVLVLEDLHWADSGTLDLLLHIGRRIARCKILVAVTFRPEEVALGRAGERHPAERIVNELRRLYGDIDVRVGSGRPEDFVASLLDSEPNRLDREFRRALCEWSGGHALFTVELLRHLRQTGAVVRAEDGCWEVAAPVQWRELPGRVEGVIAERVGRLPEEERHLLEVGCVEGEEFTAEVVARATGRSLADTIHPLARELGGRHQLVRPAGERTGAGGTLTRFRFSHFLVQQFLYQQLGAQERRLLHRGVAETLRTLRGDSPDAAVTLARHFREAGMPGDAIRYLRLAGERAALVSAHGEALGHFDRALELVPQLPESDRSSELELELHVDRLGPLQVSSGVTSTEVESAVAQVEQLCRTAAPSPALGRALLVLMCRHGTRGDGPAAERLALQVVTVISEHPDKSLILALQAAATFFVHYGRFDEARSAAEAVVATYDPARHHRLNYLLGWDPAVASLGNLSWCLWYQGLADTARERCASALELAQRLEHPSSLVYAHLFASYLAILVQDWEGGIAHARSLSSLAEENSLERWELVVQMLVACAQVVAGGQDELREAECGLRELLRIPNLPNTTIVLRYLSELLLRTDRVPEGLEAVDEGLRRARELGETMHHVELLTLRGELLARQGLTGEAEGAMRQALEVAGEQGTRMPALSAALALARLQHQAGRVTDGGDLLAAALEALPERTGHPDVAAADSVLGRLRTPRSSPPPEPLV